MRKINRVIRRCEYTEEHPDMGAAMGFGDGTVVMRCQERASWIVVFKGRDVQGERYASSWRFCAAHAVEMINVERDATKTGWITQSAIKVIDPFTGMAVTTYPDRPDMGYRIQKASEV